MRRKYGNRIVKDRDGNTFHSAGELERWRQLLMMESAGLVKGLRRQVPIELPAIFENGRRAKLVVDFQYVQDGAIVHEDFKGFESALSKFKRAAARFVGIDVRLSA